MLSRVGLGLLLLVASCSFAWDDYDPRLGGPSTGGGTTATSGSGGTATGSGGAEGGAAGSGGQGASGGQGGTTGSGGQGGSGDWFDQGLVRRRPLDVAWPEAGSGVLTDFPVLLRIDGTMVPDLAGELRIVADDQSTLLAHEVERLAPSAESLVWLKVPTLGADPLRLWLYYDGNAESEAVDPTDTWSNEFVGVWHLTESLTDSTALANDAVGNGALPIEGNVGQGYSFDGDGDYLEIPADTAFDTLFVLGGTVSVLIRPASHGEIDRGRIIDRTTEATFDGGWSLLMSGYSVAGSVGWGYGYAGAWGWWTTPADSVVLGSWVHVAASFTETAPLAALYLDGVPQTVVVPNPPSGESNAVDGIAVRVGGRSGEIDRDYQGDIDEVRLASEVRSDEWLAAEAASMSGALVTVGAAQIR